MGDVRRAVKAAERAGRRHLAGILRLSLPPASREALPEAPSSVLVVRPDSRLGNLVLLEPLLAGLRERFPGCRIAVLASDRFSSLVDSQGYETIPVPKALYARRPWLFPSFAARLRDMSFDVAIDASHPRSFSLSGAAAAALTGTGARIGFAARGSEGWYSHTVPAPPAEMHESASLHSLGSVWSGWPSWRPPRLAARESRPRNSIGLHVGASRGKSYPLASMKELLVRMVDTAPVEIYWNGPGERAVAESLAVPGASITEPMDIRGLLDSLSGLRLFVSADNGPMHMASALGVPVIALFRIGDFQRFGPLSPGSRVLFDCGGPDPELAAEAVRRAFAG